MPWCLFSTGDAREKLGGRVSLDGSVGTSCEHNKTMNVSIWGIQHPRGSAHMVTRIMPFSQELIYAQPLEKAGDVGSHREGNV